MPEGDTIHRIAAYFAERLPGRTITEGEVARRPDLRLAGREIRAVRAVGKHLYLDFVDGAALRSHLGMWGTWHRYATGEKWRKPARRASIRFVTEETEWVCFDAREIELVAPRSVRSRELREAVGPDLLGPAVEPAALVARARALRPADSLIADVLLDQRIAAGIGNVYKCEVLFLGGVHPRLPLARVDDRVLAFLYSTAADLLRLNVRPGERVTRFEDGGTLWVYGRIGERCWRCNARIAYARLGVHWRATYWCPRCQSEEPSDSTRRMLDPAGEDGPAPDPPPHEVPLRRNHAHYPPAGRDRPRTGSRRLSARPAPRRRR